MSTFRTEGFHHVTMVSGDASRTTAFYRDLLGLELVKVTVNFDDPSSYHLYFGTRHGAPGTLLTFFEWPSVPRGRWGVGGVHHVALSVADEAAQLKWKRRLTDAGVRAVRPGVLPQHLLHRSRRAGSRDRHRGTRVRDRRARRCARAIGGEPAAGASEGDP